MGGRDRGVDMNAKEEDRTDEQGIGLSASREGRLIEIPG